MNHCEALPAGGARLYNGHVMHARMRPVRHQFRYPIFFVGLDVDQLPPSRWWLGINRPGLASFRCADHGDGSGNPAAWLRGLLQQHGLDAVDGRIELHCFPRVLAYHFKPVSFWYCHDRAGELRAVLAEVNNTFGERHSYLLQAPGGAPIKAETELTAQKVLHVSPFCEVRGCYRFRFGEQDGRRSVYLDYHDEDGLLLATSMHGSAQPLTMAALLRTFLAYPWQSLSIILRIHWQALLLFFKRVPWFSKPDAPTEEPSS